MRRPLLTLFALFAAGLFVSSALAADSKHTCLMFAARNIGNGTGNFFIYCGLSHKQLKLKKGDVLEYDLFFDKTCPLPQGGIEIETDRGNLRDSGAADQRNRKSGGNANVPDAVGKWYHRRIPLDLIAGDTTRRFSIFFEGDPPGLYVQCVDNVVITHRDGAKDVIYSGGDLPDKPDVTKEGYSKVILLRSVPRSAIRNNADLKPLYEDEAKKMAIEGQIADLRGEIEIAHTIADRAHDAHMLQHISAATALVEAAEKKETVDPDTLQSLIHEVHATLNHDHPQMEKYTGYLVGHAHIDFQWLWEWPETIQVCHDTFNQALKFMDEFPGFKFSQSSTALYAATEENFPDIFKGIQKQVAAGNWEIVGGRVCEGDENMISPESHARQFLYGQRYFRERFNGKTAIVGWEPDTFGHTWQMPQILLNGGCRYIYFCRGGCGIPLFWWVAPDGSKVLAFDDKAAGSRYDGDVTLRRFNSLMDFNDKTGIQDMLWVYGVGNHGGGPTRENIQTAIDFQKTGALPKVKFATATEFFQTLDQRDTSNLRMVHADLNNDVFYGTYTTHSDIKRWNRDAEAMTESAEAIAAVAAHYGFDYPNKEFRHNWEDICWNHHHDTLPGTSIHPSYNKSEAMYQRATESSREIGQDALTLLATKIKGDANGVVVFNPCAFERDGIVEVAASGATVAISDKETAEVQKTADGKEAFYATKLPPLGYRTYKLQAHTGLWSSQLRISEDGTTLENPQYKVVIDPARGVVTQIIDKATNRNAIAAGGSGNRLEIHWENGLESTAWIIGKIEKVQPLVDPVQLKVVENGPARVAVAFDRQFQSTTLHQTISLASSGPPQFELATEWKELGNNKSPCPFLKVAFDVAAENPKFIAQTPFGNIEKPTDQSEIAALTFCDLADDHGGAALINDCKYGYSAENNVLRLSLIRSTYHPDKTPNDRPQMAKWSFIPHPGNWRDAGVLQTAQAFNHPLWTAPLQPAAGAPLPAEMSFLSVDQPNVIVTGVKKAEDDNDLIVRYYEAYGKPTTTALKLPWPVMATQKVNFVEDPMEDQQRPGVLRGYQIQTLKLKIN